MIAYLLIMAIELLLTGFFIAIGFHFGGLLCSHIHQGYQVAKIQIMGIEEADRYDPVADFFIRAYRFMHPNFSLPPHLQKPSMLPARI